MKKSLVKEFETKIKKELKPHMGKPVAISGGIDSGTLAALAKPRFVISVDLPGGDKYHEGKYARMVARHLGVKHIIVKALPSKKEFERGVEESVKAIGRPIPHFNVYPLYAMYKKLAEMGETELILGDGPDETLCGYARNLIMAHMYQVYDFEAFKPYKALIDKSVNWEYMYSMMTDKELTGTFKGKNLLKDMNQVDIDWMRPDMDDMSNKIAEHFGIKNIRPYQDNPKFDKWQFDLPDDAKIYYTQYGKYILRLVAEKYLPEEIAWRIVKRGGPVFPVNKFMRWESTEGEFGKSKWMEYQKKILVK